jgi:hypothetical protein
MSVSYELGSWITLAKVERHSLPVSSVPYCFKTAQCTTVWPGLLQKLQDFVPEVWLTGSLLGGKARLEAVVVAPAIQPLLLLGRASIMVLFLRTLVGPP